MAAKTKVKFEPSAAAVKAGAAIADMDKAIAEGASPSEVKKAIEAAGDAVEEVVNPVTKSSTTLIMHKGVMMEVTVPAGIGRVCSTEAGRYTMDSVALLRVDPIADPRESDGSAIAKNCVLLATDGYVMAAVKATMKEREATAVQHLVTRLPRECCKAGEYRTITLASGGEETVFGERMAWVDPIAHRFWDPPAEGACLNPSPLSAIEAKDCWVVSIDADKLAELAAAVNGASMVDGDGRLRVLIPKDLSATASMLRVVGADGIGVCLAKLEGDGEGYVDLFNEQAERVHQLFSELPEAVRKIKAAEEEAGTFQASSDRPEPWWPEYLATSVDDLDLTFALREMLLKHALKCVGDIQKVLDAAPNEGLCSLKGVGPGKAEKVGEATLKRWNELAKASKAEKPVAESAV